MFKRLVVILGLFVFAMITLLALALVLVDPKNLDADLAGWFAERTGREVRITGGVDYEFFPWLGVRVSGLEMAQPEGFGSEPFLSVKEARLRVRLLPLLLRQEVELDRIEIMQPQFVLYRTVDAATNWGDLLEHLELDAEEQPAAPLPDLQVKGRETPLSVQPFSWQGVSVRQGGVTFVDEVAKDVISLENLEITAEAGRQFGYQASCSLESKKHAARAETSLNGRCTLTLAPLNLLLQNADLNVEVQALVEGETRNLGFSGIADADLLDRSLSLKQATLRLEGMRIGGVLNAENLLLDSMTASGQLSLLECSPEALLQKQSGNVPLCDILQNVAASTSFSATADAVTLSELKLIMPGADLTAQATVQISPSPILDITLQGDTLDLDTLLPGQQTPPSEQLLPHWLLSWPLDLPQATLACSLKRFKTGDFVLDDLELRAAASPGELELDILGARFMQGRLQASGNAQEGELYLKASLQEADGDRLSTLLFGAPHVQGRLSLEAEASSSGGTADTLWRNLRLGATLELADSALDFTTPPKLLGGSPQPSFRFKGCTAKLAMSCANLDADASRLPFTYTLTANFDSLNPAGIFTEPVGDGVYKSLVNGQMDLRGLLYLDALKPEFLGLEQTAVSLDYSGPGTHIWPTRHWEFRGQGMGRVDMAKDVLGIQDISGALPGLDIQGSLVIENAFLPGPPSRYSGDFVAQNFVPRDVLPLFEVQPPLMEGETALGRGALDASYAIDDKQMDIEVLQLVVDETTLNGRISLQGLARPGPLMHRFELRGDNLNLDQYLPPDDDQRQPEPEPWPSNWLEDLRMQGTVSLERLQALGLRYDSLQATVQAENGGLRLRPVTTRFYGGEFFSIFGLHTLPRKEGLGVSMECSIADFKLEEVIGDLGGGDIVGGNASWDMNLAGGGKHMRNLMQSLSGKARFRVENGFYTFTGGGQQGPRPRKSSQMLGARPERKARPGKTRTEFSRGAATFIVDSGQVHNDDFLVEGLLIQAQGSGRASLPAKTLDYTILVQMTGAPTIPVRIHGPFKDPTVEVSQSEMLTDTVGRLGGSVFGVFKSILTLPFRAVEMLDQR